MVVDKAYKIATIGSHSALQILKGAKDEGFSTIVVVTKGREKPYQQFRVADKIITIDSYDDFESVQDELLKENAIIIPHASFISYMDIDRIEKLRVPYFGNKKILKWESDRVIEKTWLEKAGLKLPRLFNDPKDIDTPVIVKFHGAGGGKGYFLAKNYKDFKKKIKLHPNSKKYVMQEYILGVHMYAHYFHSPLTGETELMGFDKRYESNVDSLGRISARDQMALPKEKVDPSYVIVGNIPIVVRESFLPRFIKMGEEVVRISKELVPGGLFGPFCLENIMTPDEGIYTFEISARIVAGTNPYVNGSPYTWLRYDEPMSTGRRIAREIKLAIQQNKLNKLLM
ncbi:MAG: formate--phosphoribosylaminoimidazolecarboxamide ligase [Nanoarchaeota archaeon]|nr:formate--phosphoribosylaminoimidazolecarboxamide ligase [Nanoarchaeota archaeon]MBU1004950.1 formate--phosphoribosylaminoimidazolecarboxamide ligase [Nanoarchaeota archaeon]MBU1945604.1 formate--phosphoribosylaminoimidazolecarboxamide ligase [Nanoarchaeota archaeon]